MKRKPILSCQINTFFSAHLKRRRNSPLYIGMTRALGIRNSTSYRYRVTNAEGKEALFVSQREIMLTFDLKRTAVFYMIHQPAMRRDHRGLVIQLLETQRLSTAYSFVCPGWLSCCSLCTSYGMVCVNHLSMQLSSWAKCGSQNGRRYGGLVCIGPAALMSIVR